ncbi:MAG TPA: hypothetical protein DEF41_14375 [Desulfovibrio sp.]|nr:hypothetical protein [Desulfovibrio sp.]
MGALDSINGLCSPVDAVMVSPRVLHVRAFSIAHAVCACEGECFSGRLYHQNVASGVMV